MTRIRPRHRKAHAREDSSWEAYAVTRGIICYRMLLSRETKKSANLNQRSCAACAEDAAGDGDGLIPLESGKTSVLSL